MRLWDKNTAALTTLFKQNVDTSVMILAPHRSAVVVFLVASLTACGWTSELSRAVDSDVSASQDQPTFAQSVAPFLENHCVVCHSGDEAEGGVDLAQYEDSANVQSDAEFWDRVVRVLKDRQMPPEDEPQPSADEIAQALAGIEHELTSFGCGVGRRPGRITVRRLNRAEYNNTIRDLLGIDFRPADDFPSDDVGNGFDNMGDVLTLSPILLEKYLLAAEQIVDKVFADETALKRIFVHEPNDDVDILTATRRNVRQFATRAFRRPVTDDELGRILSVMIRAYENGFSTEDIRKTGLQAVLASPHFLFRVEDDTHAEDDDKDPEGVRKLNAYEIASRLSYFLWSSMPDERLFELADTNELRKESVLVEQVRRMLADPKAAALVDNFAGQWLQLRDLQNLTPDTGKFTEFDDELRTAMRTETELFFASVIREDRSLLDFLTANYTFVDERLAHHYGIDGVHGEQFQRVRLDNHRRGLLTQASILLLTSNPRRTSPVKRGKWILDNILGEPPSPPPANVEELDEDADEIGTLRQRMEQHRSNEACAICHRKMDALGFGLENFDAIGAWRDKDGEFPIDASGTLPGNIEFDGPSELMMILAEQKREEFCRCLTKKMLTYALGRGLGPHDRCAVNQIIDRVADNEYRFSSLVTGIVLSEPFLLREVAQGEE